MTQHNQFAAGSVPGSDGRGGVGHSLHDAAPSPHTAAGRVLDRAREIVEVDRRNEHGAPERTFGSIAAYWTTYLRQRGLLTEAQTLQPDDVCRLMVLLKIARGGGADNAVDAAGYAALAWEVGH